MKIIKQKYQIKASVANVWQALNDSKKIDAWGGGPAKMSDKKNFEFSLWDGQIHGKNLVIIKNKKLIQDWYSSDWKSPSKVIFNISSKGSKTTVQLTHENVPINDFEDISTGWKDYYLGPMKNYLEEGDYK